MDTKVPFRIVRGTEQAIMESYTEPNHIYPDGAVYFATDTRKIYYSSGTTQLTPMGGNSGVWYGRMNYSETPEETQVDFDFQLEDIEGNDETSYSIPNENDLIFNNPDGCFYRIMEKEGTGINTILHCKKLTVSGGGGGGSGGGGNINTGIMTLSRLGNQSISVLQNQDCFIRFRFTATDAAGEPSGNGTYTLYVKGIARESNTLVQGESSLNIKKYLELGTNEITLSVSGNVGTDTPVVQTKKWNVTVTSLTLTWDYDETTLNTRDTITFNWRTSTSLPHTTYIVIDEFSTIELGPNDLNVGIDKSYTINRREWGLTHGAHEVKIYAEVMLDGTIHHSDSVSHLVICVDEDRSDTIIGIPTLPAEINQYDTLSIPIFLYDPTSSDNTVSATLRENAILRDQWIGYINGGQYYWNYTPVEAGDKHLVINSGTAEVSINLTVSDLGLATQEVQGYDFKFKASDIISNNFLQNWSYGNITTHFSENFDWTNGGLKTEVSSNGSLQNYIAIKAGDRLSFNYQPFQTDKKSEGFTIKIIFKASACRNYDASILTIGNADNNDRVYLHLKANEGVFQAAGEKALTVPYCENSYIEFEIDIWPSNSTPYLMTWLDGVPASASTYSNTTTFFQNPARDIVIGSDDCDVYLYMIKVYPRHLSNEQHLANFIMDAPNAQEIVARYNRNNILDEKGEISYQKLIEHNPNCDVYLYEIPRITKNKKDKVKNCTYQRYKGKTTPLQTAEGVTMAVQGTSSAAYGLAAFNFNSTFTQGFTDYSKVTAGEHLDAWAMNENAMPINDFNTKVNVASCEGVNNALNQEWYNKYVPYVTEYQIKNPKSRNTMEFMNMGVVFFKDLNQVVDDNIRQDGYGGLGDNVFKWSPNGDDPNTAAYLASPYYKMYSICNMGNIKRNPGVFSDLDNPYDVIMENPDNQSVYQQMTGNVDENGKLIGVWEGDKFYPLLMNNEYLITKDSIAKADKTYYQRTGTEGNYMYIPATGLVVGETSVVGLYELYASGSKAPTEVYEWRAVPEDTWNELKEAHPNDPAYDFRKQAEDAWTSLVAWFAINNPNAATGAELPVAETYDSYTFKGYTSRADRIAKDGSIMPAYTPSNQILKGLSISTYAGTYTHDTYERRMAKMLQECEDHLIMDEILFHYLFIERHALIDNVAKNTFWHTEDLQHWSMIKDYDNDTSDGNDNSGHLTLTYGYETLDHVDHDSGKSFVFNAASSVWLHFTHNLLEARTKMYQALDDSGAWSATPYLAKFDEWQSSLPERVWIEDYYRKYLRPKEIYGATQFLPMLEGGKKTHQRRQFETYQEAYMSSEYGGLLCKSSLVDIRANGHNISEMSFPMTMYADCYIRIAAGSGHDPNVRERYRRGTTANIHLPVSGDANDMTTYFYLAKYITSLGNVELLSPKKVDISAAERLKEFSIKATDASPNLNLEETSFANNKMLEKLEITNCPNATNALDLSNSASLKYLDVRGSGFGTIKIATDAPVETMHLNDPSILSFTNLSKVLTFDIVDTNLSSLFLNNIDISPNADINSKAILTRQHNDVHTLTYNLQNVKWTISDPNEIDNGKILILEKLLKEGNTPYLPLEEQITDKKFALSGELHITADAYNDSNSINIYNRYAIEPAYNFPNLNIIFEGAAAQLYDVSIADGNNNITWTKKAQVNTVIDAAFLATGPNGAFNLAQTINKENTAAQTFTFGEKWEVYNADTNELIRIIDRTTEEDKSPYDAVGITNNIIIVPVFTENVRCYNVTVYVDNATKVIKDVPYGSSLLETVSTLYPAGAAKSDSDLPLEFTYAFKGWGLHATSQTVITSEVIVQNDVNVFALFEEKSVRSNVHPEWFNYAFVDANDPNIVNVGEPGRRSVMISPISTATMVGKVTIPTTLEINGVQHDVVWLRLFQDCSKLTHIFFEDPAACKVEYIDQDCFSRSGLKYFEFTDSLRIIGMASFYGTNLDITLGDANTKTYTIGGAGLKEIRADAFRVCLTSHEAGWTVIIPSQVEQIHYGAFAYENEMPNCTINIGSAEHGSLWDIQLNSLPNVWYSATTGYRFAQNARYNISINFYSAKYSSIDDVIPPYENKAQEVADAEAGYPFCVRHAFSDNNGIGLASLSLSQVSP